MTEGSSGAERVTVGELGRRLDKMASDFKDDFQQVRDDISRLQFVSVDRYTAEQDAQNKAIARLEEQAAEAARQRASDRRLVWTSLVAPVIVAIVVALLLSNTGGV